MSQLIQISPDGEVTTLRPKRGKGLDLRSLGGTLKVERTTEILWNEEQQMFWITLLTGGLAGSQLRAAYIKLVGLSLPELSELVAEEITTIGGVLYFTDYEDAVAVEIEFVQAARRVNNKLV